tara:strand:- start:166 stop:294 length:129 start_codon:yes stop_codon:yes gene_type:complete
MTTLTPDLKARALIFCISLCLFLGKIAKKGVKTKIIAKKIKK